MIIFIYKWLILFENDPVMSRSQRQMSDCQNWWESNSSRPTRRQIVEIVESEETSDRRDRPDYRIRSDARLSRLTRVWSWRNSRTSAYLNPRTSADISSRTSADLNSQTSADLTSRTSTDLTSSHWRTIAAAIAEIDSILCLSGTNCFNWHEWSGRRRTWIPWNHYNRGWS